MTNCRITETTLRVCSFWSFGLHAGEVSEILAGREGLTILYCEQILEAKVPSPEEIREIARRRLENQATKDRWAHPK